MRYNDYCDYGPGREEEEQVLTVWNRVTKSYAHVSGEKAAREEIKEQKYPRNWTIIYPDSCYNCGGSWDGNRDCANYCLTTIRFKEDPDPNPTDFGEVASWGEAFEKGWELKHAETSPITAVATVSLKEFNSGKWFPIMLEGNDGLDSAEMLRSLVEVTPSVYPDNERFHLLTRDVVLPHPRGLQKVTTQFVIVYLKTGEEFKLQPVTV